MDEKREEDELEMKWKEKMNDVFLFKSLLASKSNIFLHGPNGSGKTTKGIMDLIKIVGSR